MSTLVVRAGGALTGEVRLPGDLQIAQQALVWAALAQGPSTLRNVAPRSDHRLLIDALNAMGVAIHEADGVVHVAGQGLSGLRMPRGALRAGASESTLDLVVSLLTGQRFGTRVEASGAQTARSLRTLLLPLRARGAQIAGRALGEDDLGAPVSVAPLLEGELLESVEITIPSGDPTTKLALLVSGLYARGVTAITEGVLSRDHVERALVALGAPLETIASMTVLDTSEPEALGWPGFDWTIPGDTTLAAFVTAAALSVPGSDVVLRGVGLNPTRTAFFEVLSGTGAWLRSAPKGELAGGEPVGDLRVKASSLSRLRVGGERALRVLDEVGALLALAPRLSGRLSVRDVTPLRRLAPDALRGFAALLARFGIDCTVYDDGLELDPPSRIVGARVPADVAPSEALLALLLALSAEGETHIDDVERLDALYPGFLATLSALGACMERREA